MPRFMAFHTVPGITESAFRMALDESNKWRPDRRTTILKAYCNFSDGKIVSECEASDREQFKEWIDGTGWSGEAIYKVDIVQQAGNFWSL